MNDFATSLNQASEGMRRQALRLRLTSENMANVDTPGFRRKVAEFDQIHFAKQATDRESYVIRLDESDPRKIFDPAHPLADSSGNYLGSNVNILVEVADAREAQRSYEANLKMFEQTRKMTSSLMDLLRR